MKKYFVPFDIAKQLSALGFNEPVIAYWAAQYDDDNDLLHGLCVAVNSWAIFEGTDIEAKDDYPAPIYPQVIDWLREKHDIHIKLEMFEDNTFEYVLVNNSFTPSPIETNGMTYYEALNAAITEALELIPLNK